MMEARRLLNEEVVGMEEAAAVHEEGLRQQRKGIFCGNSGAGGGVVAAMVLKKELWRHMC